MKKLVAFLLVLMVIFSCSLAYSESIDVKSMSVEELYSILEQVRDELQLRLGDPYNNRIGRGNYVVGRDIKAGDYDFICIDTDTYDNGEAKNYITIYQEKDGQREWVFSADYCPVGGHVIFSLREGMELKLDRCSGYIVPVELSWHP